MTLYIVADNFMTRVVALHFNGFSPQRHSRRVYVPALRFTRPCSSSHPSPSSHPLAALLYNTTARLPLIHTFLCPEARGHGVQGGAVFF